LDVQGAQAEGCEVTITLVTTILPRSTNKTQNKRVRDYRRQAQHPAGERKVGERGEQTLETVNFISANLNGSRGGPLTLQTNPNTAFNGALAAGKV
jgi:hypothetical protein